MAAINIGDAEGLIFDCDGTLVDSMPLHMEAWKYAFEQLGANYDRDFLYSKKGMKETDIIDSYNLRFKTNLNAGKLVKVKHDYFIRHMNDLKPIQPVTDVVHKYYGKIPMGVVSGSLRDIVFQELEIIEIKNKFQFILTADDPFKPKPAPDKFFEAARLMNLHPSRCLVFEDGDSGIFAAKSAGMMIVDVRELEAA
jgi:HAD superfamily hydrolase (TIGR01509 family)